MLKNRSTPTTSRLLEEHVFERQFFFFGNASVKTKAQSALPFLRRTTSKKEKAFDGRHVQQQGGVLEKQTFCAGSLEDNCTGERICEISLPPLTYEQSTRCIR